MATGKADLIRHRSKKPDQLCLWDTLHRRRLQDDPAGAMVGSDLHKLDLACNTRLGERDSEGNAVRSDPADTHSRRRMRSWAASLFTSLARPRTATPCTPCRTMASTCFALHRVTVAPYHQTGHRRQDRFPKNLIETS